VSECAAAELSVLCSGAVIAVTSLRVLVDSKDAGSVATATVLVVVVVLLVLSVLVDDVSLGSVNKVPDSDIDAVFDVDAPVVVPAVEVAALDVVALAVVVVAGQQLVVPPPQASAGNLMITPPFKKCGTVCTIPIVIVVEGAVVVVVVDDVSAGNV